MRLLGRDGIISKCLALFIYFAMPFVALVILVVNEIKRIFKRKK